MPVLAARAAHPALIASRVAIGIRRAVASLQPDLVRPMAFRPIDEEFGIARDVSARVGVELHHPAVDAFRVKLRIDRAVERFGEINVPPVAAGLAPLRAALLLAGLSR